jgi:hypothetical protein
VRIKGVVLKYESHIAVARGCGVDALVADIDAATRGVFQSGDDAQERRLAAPGRAEQNTKLTIRDDKGNIV